MFGYIGALCGAHAQLKKSHINVDIVYLAVSQRWKNAFDLLANTLGGFFLLVIATKGWEKAVEAMEFGYTRQSGGRLPSPISGSWSPPPPCCFCCSCPPT
ncbi:TRAP transporter small permease [Oceanimonas sp. NS1]|nr:TRAP transporter small permease [Oceanimonas sp. NS1]